MKLRKSTTWRSLSKRDSDHVRSRRRKPGIVVSFPDLELRREEIRLSGGAEFPRHLSRPRLRRPVAGLLLYFLVGAVVDAQPVTSTKDRGAHERIGEPRDDVRTDEDAARGRMTSAGAEDRGPPFCWSRSQASGGVAATAKVRASRCATRATTWTTLHPAGVERRPIRELRRRPRGSRRRRVLAGAGRRGRPVGRPGATAAPRRRRPARGEPRLDGRRSPASADLEEKFEVVRSEARAHFRMWTDELQCE